MNQYPLMLRSLVLVCLFSFGQQGWSATQGDLKDIRYFHTDERSRIVLDLSSPVEYEHLSLESPKRTVIDLKGALIPEKLLKAKRNWGSFVHRMRYGEVKKGVSRIVFDMKKDADYTVFSLLPEGKHGHRLVVDFSLPGGVPLRRKSPGKVTVIIDPGHGGRDPGAVSNNILEKDIVLNVAKKVVTLLNKTGKVKAHLTRKTDKYLELRERTQSARNHKGDIFVSIHADAAPNHKARGASVYVLSTSGASSETARVLSDHVNKSDLAGGVSMADSDRQVAATLLDFSMDYKITESEKLGRELLKDLKRVTRLHSQEVGRAGFVVLKNPDLPAVLVEIGFITNKKEAGELKREKTRASIAAAIARAIVRYAQANAI